MASAYLGYAIVVIARRHRAARAAVSKAEAFFGCLASRARRHLNIRGRTGMHTEMSMLTAVPETAYRAALHVIARFTTFFEASLELTGYHRFQSPLAAVELAGAACLFPPWSTEDVHDANGSYGAPKQQCNEQLPR